MSTNSVYIARRGDEVIYVGMTGMGAKRMTAHRQTSQWWDIADGITIEHYPTRDEAAAREVELIGLHNPRYNVRHRQPPVRSHTPRPPPDPTSEALGLAEIAVLLGVERQTPRIWRQRGVLPEPHELLAMGPVWRRGDIVTWARATGRDEHLEDDA